MFPTTLKRRSRYPSVAHSGNDRKSQNRSQKFLAQLFFCYFPYSARVCSSSLLYSWVSMAIFFGKVFDEFLAEVKSTSARGDRISIFSSEEFLLQLPSGKRLLQSRCVSESLCPSRDLQQRRTFAVQAAGCIQPCNSVCLRS